MLNSYRIQVRTTRTSLAHFVSFQHLMPARPGNKEIPKPVRNDNIAGLCSVRNDNRVRAFTLAEVLITLVIVGVVAALTIPNLMTKYQQHVYANQFKKSIYTISQIVARTRNELGVSGLGAYCGEYDGGYVNELECNKKLHENIKVVAKTTYVTWTSMVPPHTTTRSFETLKSYNNKTNFSCPDKACGSLAYVNQLADGSFLGFNVNNGLLYFSIDLNGNKRPNRLGYDIFIFSLNNKNDTVSGFLNRVPNNNIADEDIDSLFKGTICSPTSTSGMNGLGCSYYALRNKCPYDDTKTYWECLK